jgi:hypothetical protein
MPSGLVASSPPVEVGCFRSDVYGRKHCYLEGSPGRFAALLAGPELNATLGRQARAPAAATGVPDE